MRFPVFLEDEIYNSSMHLLKDRLISHGIDEDQLTDDEYVLIGK